MYPMFNIEQQLQQMQSILRRLSSKMTTIS